MKLISQQHLSHWLNAPQFFINDSSNVNVRYDTWKAKKSLQSLAQSWELWRQAFRGANTRCRHHQGMKQLLEQDRLNVARDALAANFGIGGQRWRLRIRDGPWAVGAGNSFVTGGRTLSSSPLLYKRRRKLLSSCFSNFAEAATSNLFGDFSWPLKRLTC